MDLAGCISIFRNLFVYINTHMYVMAINEKKEATNLSESKDRYMGRLGGRKGKEETMQLYYNLKNQIT